MLFAGEHLTPSEVNRYDTSRDPEQRADIWQAKYVLWHEQSATISNIFLELVRQRQQLAHNAGFAEYRAYRWQELHRFDFTPESCLTFYDAVIEEFTALATQMATRRTQRWGITTLNPWDWQLDTDPVSTEQIFATPDDLLDAVSHICTQLDSSFGTLFTKMRQHDFLDVGSRLGKPGGGEEWFFPVTRLPCVRVESTGTFQDVLLLFHECGHALHDALSFDQQGFIWNMGGPGGFDEFPSVAMPFLGLPFCTTTQGGFANQEQIAAMYVREYERIMLRWLPEIIRMELFQHWVYTQPVEQIHPSDLDAYWLQLTQRIMPWLNVSQHANDVAMSWQRSGLLFDNPFYFTEYALAQFGALQLVPQAIHDHTATWQHFTATLRAGNTRSLLELYAMMNIDLPFTAATVRAVAVDVAQMYHDSL